MTALANRRFPMISALDLLREMLGTLTVPDSLPDDLGRRCEVVHREKVNQRIMGTIYGITPNSSGKLVVLVEPMDPHKMNKSTPRGVLMLEGDDIDDMHLILREGGYDRRVPVLLLIS